MEREDQVKYYLKDDLESQNLHPQFSNKQSFFERSRSSVKQNMVVMGVGMLLLSLPISFLTKVSATFLAAFAVACIVAGIVSGMDCGSSSASTPDLDF